MMPRLGIVADDITGAGDIGGLLAGHGYAVRILSQGADWEGLCARLAQERTDALIIDTDSRFLPPDAARERVERATRALMATGCGAYWKKTCSVFRGNVGAEFDAMLGTLGENFGVAVAAFPKNGRTTLHGDHFVRGVPLPDTEFGQDPVHPRREVNLVRDLGTQTPHRVINLPIETVREGVRAVRTRREELEREGVRYVLADAETQSDLRVLAEALSGERVFLGSSGLAEELPAVWPPVEPFDPLSGARWTHPRQVVMIAGSVMPQSRAQVEHYAARGGTVHELDVDLALRDPERASRLLADLALGTLHTHDTVLLRSPNSPEQVEAAREVGAALGLHGIEVSQRVSGVLAEAARITACEAGTQKLVALGGDTSAALTRALGVTHTVVVQELAPGLPSTYAPDEGLLLVLKSGSFGPPDFLALAIDHLQRAHGEQA
ncbi:four-carbon acid sugar kinase family protein [Deinococcus aerius]|uniref:four-carbon acid sugar kinase family protein n=1 Tax=Deinococcus aerius TaxID=200253 RepID=UPI00105717CF|nr:four-carbon acid sugar kinase family protein [Deinococcus aerius]